MRCEFFSRRSNTTGSHTWQQARPRTDAISDYMYVFGGGLRYQKSLHVSDLWYLTHGKPERDRTDSYG